VTLRPRLATGLPFSQRARALAQAHTSTFSSGRSPASPSALQCTAFPLPWSSVL
jgi:hypothetical protein